MATFYSDHYGTQPDLTALPDPRTAVTAGLRHARQRAHFCRVDASGSDPANNDVIRLCTMKSSDRIDRVRVITPGDWAVGTTLNLGCHKTGDNNDGTVLDADLFASAITLDAAKADVESFKEALTLADIDRGKQLWELVVLGADPDSWTADPVIDIDITGTLPATGATGGTLLVIVEYTSGA